MLATNLLDSPVEEAFDRLTRMAARLLHAPYALVSLVDDERQFFKSAYGLPPSMAEKRELPISHSFCKHVIASRTPLVVEDAASHPLFKDNPVVHSIGIRAYAGIPLAMPNGEVLGTFCVIDKAPREWSQAQLSNLSDLAASVLTEIELRIAQVAQSEATEIMTHDLKNPLAAILLLAEHLERSAERAGEENQRKALSRIRVSAQRMRNVASSLTELNRLTSTPGSAAHETVDLHAVITESLREMAPLDEGGERIQTGWNESDELPSLEINGSKDQIVIALINLLTAAVEIGHGRSAIRVEHLREDARLGFRVRIGKGLGELPSQETLDDYFERLPGPLGSPLRKGTKLGLHLARELIGLQGGQLTVRRTGEGAGGAIEFVCMFPLRGTATKVA